ncbi:Ribonuclease H-like superfamily [Arabidopsis suecica]|uniref:Ribonuclease H-like superfamily n=1 Tax=Arabidopsis suecica TaxID=45249 RepID=A0A8T1YP41_ARASU|nr:Ribonuclease H-like superfamily [Arabidopsis suecica]
MYRKYNLPDKCLPSFKHRIDTFTWLDAHFKGKTDSQKLNELGQFFRMPKQKHRSLEDCYLNFEVFKSCSCVIEMDKIFEKEESKMEGSTRKSKRLKEKGLQQ